MLSRCQTEGGGGYAMPNIRFTCLSRRQQWWTCGLMDPERPPEHANDAQRLTVVRYGARVLTQTQTQKKPLGLGRGLLRRCTLPHRRALWAATLSVPVSDLKGLQVPQEEHCTLDSLR